jgi:hypothetical protein
MELPKRTRKRCGCYLDECPTLLHDPCDDVNPFVYECTGCGSVWSPIDGHCPELNIRQMVAIAMSYGVRIIPGLSKVSP